MLKSSNEISEEKMQEFHDRMQSYNYLRQNRVSFWQSIAIVFGTSAVILLIDLVSGEDLILKILLIVGLFIVFYMTYMQSIKQTQKPIFVCENMIGTVERCPENVKDKNSIEYSIFSMSDTIHDPHKKISSNGQNSKKENKQ